MKRHYLTWAGVTFAIVVFLLTVLVVWPTPYWYEKVSSRSGWTKIYRVNRFTGVADIVEPRTPKDQ
jgi:hypothetical protein